MSTKTVAQKLQIKPNTALWLSDPAHQDLIAPLPEGVTLAEKPAAAGAALAFVQDAAATKALLAEHATELAAVGLLWVAYPKGNRSDINRDSLWPILAEHDMRPVSQVSIDDTWSALRFRPLAEGEAQFTGGAAAKK